MHIYKVCIYSVHAVFFAGTSPNTRCIYGEYIWCTYGIFYQGNHQIHGVYTVNIYGVRTVLLSGKSQIHGHIRCMYTIMADPKRIADQMPLTHQNAMLQLSVTLTMI
jgi:hypothetical protein